MNIRKQPDHRKTEILNAAVALAEEGGYHSIRRDNVADKAGCSRGLVNRYFRTIGILKQKVIKHAIDTRNLKIIAQAVINKDPLVQQIPGELIHEALESALI